MSCKSLKQETGVIRLGHRQNQVKGGSDKQQGEWHKTNISWLQGVDIAQMVEHSPGVQEVGCSNPSPGSGMTVC